MIDEHILPNPHSPNNNFKWWTLGVVGAGTFMSAIDGSVVNTALPVIQKQIGAPVSTAVWMVLIYLLTVSSSLLIFGRLGDIYGQRVFYISGMAIFVIGSFFCGLSRNVGLLVAFRGLQGLGAAALFALGPAILTGTFPDQERGRALGMQATFTYLGLATGPTIGGLLTQHLGWPWIFFINIPIGIIVILAALRVLRHRERKVIRPFDAIGATTLTLALVALIFGIDSGARYGWESPIILISLITAGIALVLFLFVENRATDPLVDLKLFANRVFSASTMAAFLNYMATSSVNILMPFYLVSARGFRVDFAGYILVSTPLTMAIFTGWSGAISDKIGQRLPATIGMALTVIGILLLRTLSPVSPWWVIVLHLVLIGFGIGLFTSPNNSAIMGSAPRNRQGVAGAILAASRNIGFVFGTAFATIIYTLHLDSFSPTVPSSVAITDAMRQATTIIALIASVGIVISAIRGRAINMRE
jgi:EmrB/QacA subfamily drug resistance transporter